MELLAKIKSVEDSRVNYIYLDNNKFLGFSLDCDGIKPFQKDLLSKFITSLHINSQCVELLDFETNDYTVYYDCKTNFKHYIKNGQEDFLMFFMNNGVVAFDYKLDYIDYGNTEENRKDKKETPFFGVVKKFLSVGLVVVLGYSTLTALVENGDAILTALSSYSSSFNYDEDIATFDGEMISVDDAIKFINDSIYLSDEYKMFLGNRELFNDIMPYYQGTYMQEEIKMKLDQVRFVYFDRTYPQYYEGLGGYYNTLKPSVINVFEEYKNNPDVHKAVVAHEFIHLLQSNSSVYNYLTESTAELIAEEYFDSTTDTAYEEGVNSLRLLVEIIGVEPVLKGVFGGDYTDLENVLMDNLEVSDFKKIIDYMSKSPSDVINNEGEIRRIFSKLYMNMYGQDIRNDENILYDILYEKDSGSIIVDKSDLRYYFNRSKMSDKEKIVVDMDKLCNSMPDNKFLTKEKKFLVTRDLGFDEYIQYSNNEDIQLKYDSVYFNGLKVGDEYIIYENAYSDGDGLIHYDNPVQTMSVLEAVERHYLNVKLYGEATVIGDENFTEQLPEGWNFEYNDDGEKIMTDFSYKSNIQGAYIDNGELIISRRGIKDRFNVNVNSNSNFISKY